MTIRPELPSDAAAVRAVNEAAFETRAEAGLVDSLRAQASPVISLIAEERGAVCGHIMFSPVTLEAAPIAIMGLAPMAVMPRYQRRGIGSALVRAGLEACRQLGFSAVVVLGHAEFYPRFGFVPASGFGLRCEYEVPDEVFMALELKPQALANHSGTIKYHAAFSQL